MRRLAVVLVLSLAWLTTAAAQENALDTPSATRPSRPSASTLPGLTLESLAATRDRPLFAPSRRPQRSEAVARTEEDPKPLSKTRPEFVLMGTIVEGTSTFVLLWDMESNESLVVRPNDKIGNWRIVVDNARTVTLLGDGEQVTLRLFGDDSANSR